MLSNVLVSHCTPMVCNVGGWTPDVYANTVRMMVAAQQTILAHKTYINLWISMRTENPVWRFEHAPLSSRCRTSKPIPRATFICNLIALPMPLDQHQRTFWRLGSFRFRF